jgi:hypothetical protein
LWGPADVISSKRGIGNLHGETPEADLSRPSVEDAWQRSRLSENFPKAESIGITGFGKSRILETTSPEQNKSRNHEEKSGPSNIGGRVAEIKGIGKFPERKAPSVNRRSGNRGVRRARHQGSRSPDSRYPDKIWTVRSQEDLDR